MENNQKYIVPIYQKMERQGKEQGILTISHVGNGFFIENFFITAAHVIVEAGNAYINVGDEEKKLSRENTVIWRSMMEESYEYDNRDAGDVAVYRFDGVKSPLKLSESMPNMGDILDSCYYYNETWHQTKGSVGDNDDWFSGNFFGWKTDPDNIHPTEGGSSGSPLLKNNIVYGVLHAGNKEDPSICVFTSALFVKKLLLE